MAHLPTIELAQLSQTVDEGTETKIEPRIMVNLKPKSGRTVSVQYTLAEGTAKEPEDYALTSDSTGTLIFNPGETSKAIPIEIKPDNYDEPDTEIFTITLSNESNALLNMDMVSSTISIKDDDNAPKVSIVATAAENETDSDVPSSVTVTLEPASGKTVTIPYTVSLDTADETDYSVAELANRQLVFTPDPNTTITATSMEIPYTIIGDDIGEKPEQFKITLGDLINGDKTGENAISTITIIDDEAPVLSIEDGQVITESEQAIAMFPVTASFNADEITLYFTPSETGDFLGSNLTAGEMTSASIDFADSTSAILPVPIANDEIC